MLKEVHRAIEFNQKDLLKPDVDIKAELSEKSKHDFEKDL